MSIKRIVDCDFWIDDKVVETFSPEDKYFMLYLMTNPHTTQLGIYKTNIKLMAFETGYSVETIRNLLERFENTYKVISYSYDTNEIAIKNYLVYSIVKGGKPVEDLLKKEILAVKSNRLKQIVYENLKHKKVTNTVSEILPLLNSLNENDNDNDNDVSYHDTYHESCNESYHESSKHKYGEYLNVLLSDEEIEKLKEEFPTDWSNRIEKLSSYIASKGAKYKSHYATIRNWARNDKPKKEGSFDENDFFEAAVRRSYGQ